MSARGGRHAAGARAPALRPWCTSPLLGMLLCCALTSAACRRSFTSDDQRFVSNVQAALAGPSDGLDGELAAAICSDAARLGHRRAPLLRIAPGRFRDCAGAPAEPGLTGALTTARIVLATCSAAGEELLMRDDLAVFARWPRDGLEGLACVAKCRPAGCAPPCSESALVLPGSACQASASWDGQRVHLPLEEPWPRP